MTDANIPLLNEEQPVPRRGGLGPGSIVLLVGILAVVAVFGWALVQRNQTQPTAGPAPDFELTTYDGQDIRLSDLRGKVVVVNFWASWCGPCRLEAPDLQRIHERYQGQGVEVIGVAYTDTDTNALAFMDEFGMTYANGPDRGTIISDRYNIQGVPETFVVDQDGNIAKFIFAPTNEADLSAIIDDLLGV
ncbi:MAG: thiol:disulfide interchange protein [Anaerolineaceae bacterium]|nr:thiol:disulfide interchange protein [Anaerolineaceae bacterium]